MSLNKILFFGFYLCFLFSNAQNITILDAETKDPIVSAVAHNKLKDKNVISNFDGILNITSFNSNEVIYFSHIGYKETSILKEKAPAILYLNSKPDKLSQVILSVSKSKVKKSRVAEKIEIVTRKQIQRLAPQTTADLLAKTPGLRVQKSQSGGGSPVIRGFEANRVLLVMDNVRMNNAIYRSGHLQNSITISPYSLERTEIIFGPSSVIYGSDALGGVVHFYTKTPKINSIKPFEVNTNTRFSSVNNEFTQGFGTQFSSKKWASYSALSLSDFGDIRMGKNRNHGYKNWGLVPMYSENNDVIYNENPTHNNKPYIQKNTGYSQVDFLQKFNFKVKEKNNLIVNFQLSESSNINRFDKLTELKNESLKFAEWYYGPQKRLFLSTQYQFHPNSKWIKDGLITGAYQKIEESRIKRKFGNLERTHQNENVDVYSVNADFNVVITKNRALNYGAEITHNNVQSKAHGNILNISNSTIQGIQENTVVQSRYPDGGSNYSTAAIYANYRQDINNKMTLNTGGRFTHTRLNANFHDQTYISLPQKDLSINNSSFTANLGLTYNPSPLTKWNTVISSGFRSPNIDDIGKIREKNGLLTVPNVNLKPEYAYNAEIGFTKFTNNKKNYINTNIFYTHLRNFISRDTFILENDTSTIDENTVIYDGEEVTTIANVNGENAAIYGGTIDLLINPISKIYIKANLTYTNSKTNQNKPLPSISPLLSTFAIQFKEGKFDAEISYISSSKKDADNYSPNGEDNLEQSPTNQFGEFIGTPSWSTLNTSLSYQHNKTIGLQIGLTNIFDIHYKEFASGISSPGRNFSTSLVFNF